MNRIATLSESIDRPRQGRLMTRTMRLVGIVVAAGFGISLWWLVASSLPEERVISTSAQPPSMPPTTAPKPLPSSMVAYTQRARPTEMPRPSKPLTAAQRFASATNYKKLYDDLASRQD